MEERIITSQECISEGLVALNKLEPKFRQAINAIDEIPLRRTSGGFDRLLSTIVSQQLSVAAADAIWKKIELAGLNQINKIKKVSSVKNSILSTPLSYMGFSGYINPFTLEAQINVNTPQLYLPTTICHEIAHQMGYSAENEAIEEGEKSKIRK